MITERLSVMPAKDNASRSCFRWRASEQKIFLVGLLLFCLISATTKVRPTSLSGDYFTHDPSRIVECNGKYFVYCTGPNCQMRYSSDMMHWTVGPSVLAGIPLWARAAVPGNTGDWIWAPDVIYLNNQYYLYYSFSTFGSKVSAIGLATSPSLDPSSPDYRWTDQGAVVESGISNDYNAIDPCPVLDAKGDLWMSFGSWNDGGIELVRLDNKTGKPVSAPKSLASGKDRLGPEGSFVAYHRGYYYLWDSEGWCCQGMNSTYHILVGRSRDIAGPYVDKMGLSMLATGGSLFLRTDGVQFGPGCMGLSRVDGADICSYHYYDGLSNGRPTLAIEPLKWAADGWPYLAPDRRFGAGPQISDGGHFALIGQGGELALTVHGIGDRDGAAIGQDVYNANPLQEWNVSPTGDGYFSIASLATGKFIDAPDSAPANSGSVDQARWNNLDNQKWSIEQVSSGVFKIVSKAGDEVLTAAGPDGAIGISAWSDRNDQNWSLKRL
jgi:arabinan endo-1,5-alpha-L-arabinosidase